MPSDWFFFIKPNLFPNGGSYSTASFRLSAFAASDFVIIPVRPDYFSTLGLPQFLGTLEDFKSDLVDNHQIRPLGVVFTNVPRVSTPETTASIRRVAEALTAAPFSVPIFSSQMSNYKVYEKTLWQSVPVQQVKGRGTASKASAGNELRQIVAEMIQKIAGATSTLPLNPTSTPKK